MPTTATKRHKTQTPRLRSQRLNATDTVVACWEDDPGDPKTVPPLAPVACPVPDPSASPLPYKISGTAPKPAVYSPGTKQFLYFANAAALRRTANFWATILPAGTKWQIGKVLPVQLDSGVDLNAFYTRGGAGESPGLHFFHDTVAGRLYFSGESPDVACHEMGHAVLDAIRPQLFNAQTIEAAAFHESFGDMSAILSVLQLPAFRQQIINETGGALNRSSRMSRLAEQLGAAIRVSHPDAVEPDCLRNASNSFFYRDPQTLPPIAPASQLSSEPHSFSRVFTAGFLDSLAGMFKLQSQATPDSLLQVADDIGKILVGGILEAPVVPDYFSQVAAHMIHFGEGSPFNGKYRDPLKSAFVRRGILSLQAAAAVTPDSRGTTMGMIARPADVFGDELPLASIPAAQYGLSGTSLHIHTAEEPKRFAVTSASLTLGSIEPRSPQNAAESYTEDLFQRGHVAVGPKLRSSGGLHHAFSFKSHEIQSKNGQLVLERIAFDCGFAHRDELI
jgi:hypothetical protein